MALLSRDLDQSDFKTFSEMAYNLAGIELNETKRHLVISRLIRRVRALKLKDLAEYRKYLQNNQAQEKTHFVNAITTNLTFFFREEHHFQTLSQHIQENHIQQPRIWSAACSTGQEPYSIAITLAELGISTNSVLSTDIDTQCVETASQGVYREEDIKSIDLEIARKHFLKGSGRNAGTVKVKPHLRSMVDFAQVNLLDTLPDGPFDAIFCRNVFIYFDIETQMNIVLRFAKRLAPGGLLFLGHSELLRPPEDLFSLCGKTTFQRVGS